MGNRHSAVAAKTNEAQEKKNVFGEQRFVQPPKKKQKNKKKNKK